MPKYRIKDWDVHFENAASRKLKRLDWVAVPNKTDGEGYTALVDHPNAAAHLGAWLAIVEVASKQTPRGMLPVGGISQDVGGICQALGRISRLPGRIFQEAIPRLLDIGWIEEVAETKRLPKTVAESADVVAESADVVAEDGATRARMLFPSLPCNSLPPGDVREIPEPTVAQFAEAVERMYGRHPKKKDLVLIPGALQKALQRSTLPEIEMAHAAWCDHEDWRKDNGRYCPSLAKWLEDRGYDRLPVVIPIPIRRQGGSDFMADVTEVIQKRIARGEK